MKMETYDYPTEIILFISILTIIAAFILFMVIIFFMKELPRNKFDYNELHNDLVLLWYDGPLLTIMIDKNKNYYLEHNIDNKSIIAKVDKKILLEILKSEKPINFAFESSNEKYECNSNIENYGNYNQVNKFNELDLFDKDTTLIHCGNLTECIKDYIEKLEKWK